MTHGLPPSGPGGPQIPGGWQPPEERGAGASGAGGAGGAGGAAPPPPTEPPTGRPAWTPPGPPEPQMRGPLAPRPEGWEPPPRRTMAERDEAVKSRLGKIGGPVAFIGLLIWKVGRYVLLALGKIALLFKIPLLGTVISGGVSIAAYAWIWGWSFAIAIMVTLLVHELGHVIQIKREGMPVHAMNFVPFLGAYVQSDAARTPAQGARISIAGPLTGALLASAIFLAAGDSALLHAIAYTGFYLNLLNLIPIGFLDGGGATRPLNAGWWVIVTVALVAIGLGSGSAFALILAIAGGVQIYTRRRSGFTLDDPADGIAYRDRVNAAVLYIGVAAVCAFGMAATYADRTDVIVQAPHTAPAVALR